MKLIVETDIGHDPDDFFALCYLFSAGVDIKAILISPGDESQIAVVKFILKMLDKEQIKIGVPELGRRKEKPTNIHKDMLDKYKFPYFSSDAELSKDLFDDLFKEKNLEFFGCGPLKNFNIWAQDHKEIPFDRATMQGGFIGYAIHSMPVVELDKFKYKIKVPTFNLNGCKSGAKALLDLPIQNRRFVSKNVCHTITYDKKVHDYVKSIPTRNRASELIREGMDFRFKSNPGGKVFHDPTAAICHLHPEIAIWVKARLFYEKGEWGATLNAYVGDWITVDIDRNELWYHLAHGT